MKRGHEWKTIEAGKPHIIRRPNARRAQAYKVLAIGACMHCKTKRVVVQGPRGGPSLHYELAGDLWWWAPKCVERES